MKLCKDCEHYQVLSTKILWWEFTIGQAHSVAKCGATIDPVDGRGKEFCEFMRKAGRACGPDGGLFEPRTSKRPITV